MSKELLSVEDLKVSFKVNGGTVTVVNGVSFKINEGQTLGVVGESGCGKSVTATSILRLLPKRYSQISGGQILFYEKDLVKMTEEELRTIRGNEISMIFQEPMTSLNPVQRIGTQLLEMVLAHRKVSRAEAWDLCVNMLKEVEIPEPERRMKAYPHELSGGMRQRIMIAMAMVTEPKLLIADEPTTALDVTIQAQILALMDKLKRDFNTAILLITHDMGVVAEVADYVMVMYAGEVVEYGDVESVFENPLHPYTQGLLKSIPRLDSDDQSELATIEGTVPDPANMPKACRFSTRCPFANKQCQEEKPPMLQQGLQQVRCWLYASKDRREA